MTTALKAYPQTSMSKSNSTGSEFEGNLKFFIEEVKKYANYISNST
jgi:hypothetical protein